MTNERVVTELRKLHDAWAAATTEKDCWEGTIIGPDRSKQLCADELKLLITQLEALAKKD